MSHKTELLSRKDGESLTDWTLRFLADAQRHLRNVQDVHKPCGCKCSTGICGCLTFGTGYLDFNGFWSVPCPHGNERHTCYDSDEDMDRRRLVDLYHACTPREAEFAEGGEE